MTGRETTKLTLENESGTYTVEVPYTEMHIDRLFDDLVTPIMHAAGYHPDAVKRCMGDDE